VPSTDYQTISCNVADRICVLELNRPEKLNAFTVQMAAELEAFFRAVNDDDSIGAIIVIGAGKAFCAGMDLSRPGNVFGLDDQLRPTLNDLVDRFEDDDIAHAVHDTGGRVALAIHDCRKPVIAAINGDAVGIGATMTLAMDFRLATANARIGFVFGRLGIVPEACSTWFLSRLVGPQTALEWTLTAEIIDAATAEKKGLLRSVHSDRESLLAEARALALRIVQNRSPVAIALTRQMMRRNASLPTPADAHRIESLAMFYTAIGDGAEGVAAFLEKRPPQYKAQASVMPPIYPWWDDSAD
jgi:enoyl-CoA hydratase/carnithine racemase